ncbi:hypothetical protein CN213_32515 [Sinorhizobium meliloti]|nr:hypothetical protein CN213_32515 [Sinorhizobium meliloti]
MKSPASAGLCFAGSVIRATVRHVGRAGEQTPSGLSAISPTRAGESHLANKRLFCCGKSILGVLR